MPDIPPILSCQGVTKRFGPVLANQGVDLDVESGRIHAILGENGAGKSTLMSILAGRYRPDSGTITLRGREVRFSSPAQALQLGVGMVYQRFMLVEPLTVEENVRLAAGGPPNRMNAAGVRREMADLSRRYGLEVDPDKKIWQLSMGERQRVEIIKLLIKKAEILIFDEPTAVLAQPEIESFFQVLRKMKADGRAVLFITHKLEEVLAVADRISILRRGRMVAGLKPEEIHSKRELARLMVGREIVLRVDKDESVPGEIVLETAGLSGMGEKGRPAFEDISLAVRRGEILSVVGVAGNGQAALAAGLAGLSPLKDGHITFNGRRYPASTWSKIRPAGLAYVPEERYSTGSIGAMSLTDNFILTRVADYVRHGLLDGAAARGDTLKAIEDFGIVAEGPETKAGHLSGGNLQKLILARELSRLPDLFIAEQPTQGLDIKATEEVWQSLIQARSRSAVLLFTGDLREALSLSDRIAVIFRGRILAVIEARDAEAMSGIGLLMAGSRE